MTLPVQDADYPTPSQIRDAGLAAVKYCYARIGITRNVSPGSDDYVRFDKFADRAGIAIANNQLAQADFNPLTAVDPALTNLCAVFGVFPRPAAGSAGAVAATWAGTAVTIPMSFTGTTPDGNKYTAAPGTYTTGTPIPVSAVGVGAATNEISGAVLTWDSAAIGSLNPSATVTSAGLTGGVDADGQETMRQRLLLRLSAAAVGGNWSSVIGWASGATASVEAAYCYPAAGGPASYRVAVTALGGQRTLPPSIVSLVSAAVLANMPGQNLLICTSVTPQGVDVSLKARLPLPQGAGGAGGGWRDAAPWPGEDCKVTAYNSPTATVNSVASPSVGSSIGIWDPNYVDPVSGLVVGIMCEYSVATVGGSTGAWTITVQGGFGNLTSGTPLGAYVSAGAINLIAYAQTFAAGVSVLGPGEVTALPELMPMASRKPTTDMQAPSDLTSRLLDASLYPAVIDLQWGVQYETGTTTTIVTPSVPTSPIDPPNIFVLSNFAIRME